jgi:fluoride ion exporter CrcB/FEX
MLELMRDLWQLMRERRKLWLAPLIVIMLLLGLLVIAQGTVLAPFIYAIF